MPRALIIDDSAFEVEQVKAILIQMGFNVAWAYSGAEGMKQAKNLRPDLILLDLVLPDINGHEVCRWLQSDADTHLIPVIMVTIKEQMDDKVLGLDQGANDYITKPFDARELKARVNACLRMKQFQNELIRKNEEYKELLEKVQELAITDPVTGLFNRRYFHEVLQQEFSRSQRYGALFSCLMIDVDHFKQINDTFGHDAGDFVLKEIGRIVQLQIRDADLSARFGGDELAVLLLESPREKARQVAQRILKDVWDQAFPPLKSQRVSVSIGISGLPDPDLREAVYALQAADFALYRAKRAGRNRAETATLQEMLSQK